MSSSEVTPTWLDEKWFAQQSHVTAKLFSELVDNPDPLLEFLRSRKTRRLGIYFESLWHFWLANQSRFELIASNLVVRDEKRTLGEFDLIVRDVEQNKTWHWELAVKFYLGVGETQSISNWWGPRQRDRLDIKINRLASHQTQLSRNEIARQQLADLGIHVDQTAVVLKGRMFYPYAEELIAPDGSEGNHQRGRWLSDREFSNQRDLLELDWMPLTRSQWLAPIVNTVPSDVIKGHLLVQQWKTAPIEQPGCYACVDAGYERYRLFITQSDWGGSITEAVSPL